MDEKFETVWRALVEHGSSRKSEDAVRRFWNTLTAEQQRLAYENIPRKVKEGKFVQYDPIRAIRENIRDTRPKAEPKNWNGHRLDPDQRYVTARWNGRWGTYSVEDARRYGMEVMPPEPSSNHCPTFIESLS